MITSPNTQNSPIDNAYQSDPDFLVHEKNVIDNSKTFSSSSWSKEINSANSDSSSSSQIQNLNQIAAKSKNPSSKSTTSADKDQKIVNYFYQEFKKYEAIEQFDDPLIPDDLVMTLPFTESIEQQNQPNDKYPHSLLNQKSSTSSQVQNHSKPNFGQNFKIFFHKTHKTGSSTFQNILLRYGQKNNLNFALPRSTTAHVYNYNVKFSSWMVRKTVKINPENSEQHVSPPAPDSLQPSIDNNQILCNHLHYDFNGVSNYFNPNSTLYLSIVRDPITHFKSILSYYSKDVFTFQNLLQEFKSSNSSHPVSAEKATVDYLIHKFLQNPYAYTDKFKMTSYEHFYKNPMAYDFGIDDFTFKFDRNIPDEILTLINRKNSIGASSSEAELKILSKYKKLIQKTLKSFHFILNMNYFDESLVLLNSVLNWKWEDLAFVKKNSRYDSFSSSSSSESRRHHSKVENLAQINADNPSTYQLSESDIVKLKNWNYLDFHLYDLANQTFFHQMENFGKDRLNEGLNKLRTARYKITRSCIDHGKSGSSSFKYSATGIQIQKYVLLNDKMDDFECNNLRRVVWRNFEKSTRHVRKK